MTNLSDISKKYSTDKAGEHDFIPVYEEYLNDRREDLDKLLEIGVYKGESLKMWREYLPDTHLYGIDKSHYRLDIPNAITFKCDQSNVGRLTNIVKKIQPLDIIIDDCSHKMDDQQISFAKLFRYVRSGGIYVIEDVHTSNDWQLERYNISLSRDNTTLKMINNYVENNSIVSLYIEDEDKAYLESNIKFMKLHDTNNDGKHLICFIGKK